MEKSSESVTRARRLLERYGGETMKSLASTESRDEERVIDLTVIYKINSVRCVSQLQIRMLLEEAVYYRFLTCTIDLYDLKVERNVIELIWWSMGPWLCLWIFLIQSDY